MDSNHLCAGPYGRWLVLNPYTTDDAKCLIVLSSAVPCNDLVPELTLGLGTVYLQPFLLHSPLLSTIEDPTCRFSASGSNVVLIDDSSLCFDHVEAPRHGFFLKFSPKFGNHWWTCKETQARRIALSRSATSDAAKALIARGVKVAEIDTQNVDNLTGALKGTDVFVDAIVSTPDTTVASSNFIKAAAKSEVKLYIPSEFNDYQGIDFEHPFWEGKRAVVEEAIKAGLRVARFSVSAFLEDSFSPALGFDIANSTVNIVGTAENRCSFTSKTDVGFSVAGVIALWIEDPSAVPHTVVVASDTLTYGEAQELHSKGYGREFRLETEDQNLVKRNALVHLPKAGDNIWATILVYLRLLHANGVGDHSVNHNELINAGEKYWKWKKIANHIEETKTA
ncbi:hypothetical protein FRC02_010631 [Tulasnella sp. 418]|nr:hypothetical protein FRC02_010631 [Tulasnella sp. 418]